MSDDALPMPGTMDSCAVCGMGPLMSYVIREDGEVYCLDCDGELFPPDDEHYP